MRPSRVIRPSSSSRARSPVWRYPPRKARAVASARAAAADARVRPPVFVASVCGTEADPQRFSEQCAVLEREDVRLCESNAQAVMLALLILRQAAARPHAVGGPS